MNTDRETDRANYAAKSELFIPPFLIRYSLYLIY